MRLYPVFLRLSGRPVLVVGGGDVGARKARGLLAADAKVTAVAPRFSADFPPGATRFRRRYRASDVRGKLLVVAATDDAGLNARIAGDARAAGALANVVDDPHGGDYHVPAVLRKGLFSLAISTGGASPALAKRLRLALARRWDGLGRTS